MKRTSSVPLNIIVLFITIFSFAQSPKESLKELVGIWKVIESSYTDPPEGIVTVIPVSDGNAIFSTWRQGIDQTFYEANALWGYSESSKEIRVFEVNTAGVAETHVGYFDDSGTLILELRDPDTNSLNQKRTMIWTGDTWKMTALFIVDGNEVNHHAQLIRQ